MTNWLKMAFWKWIIDVNMEFDSALPRMNHEDISESAGLTEKAFSYLKHEAILHQGSCTRVCIIFILKLIYEFDVLWGLLKPFGLWLAQVTNVCRPVTLPAMSWTWWTGASVVVKICRHEKTGIKINGVRSWANSTKLSVSSIKYLFLNMKNEKTFNQ